MKQIKKYGIKVLITELSLLFILSITTFIYYKDILNTISYQIINYILFLIIILINSFTLGKKSNKNGYLEGLKLGLIIITINFILVLIFKTNINLRLIFYSLIILLTSSLGAMIGINKK